MRTLKAAQEQVDKTDYSTFIGEDEIFAELGVAQGWRPGAMQERIRPGLFCGLLRQSSCATLLKGRHVTWLSSFFSALSSNRCGQTVVAQQKPDQSNDCDWHGAFSVTRRQMYSLPVFLLRLKAPIHAGTGP